MGSFARTTLTILAVVATAAIVGVAHAAEARTATAAAARPTETPRTATSTVTALRPTDDFMETGRFRWGKPSWNQPSYSQPIYKFTRPTYSSTKNTFTTAVGVTKTCVSPIIAIGGTTSGTVTAVCDASTPAQFSRWFNKNNKYAFNKHVTSHKNTHTITHTQKNICCDGYVCKGASQVTAKLVGTLFGSTTQVSIVTDNPAPYVAIRTNNNACCLPQDDFDVTQLLCRASLDPGTACPVGVIASGDLASFDKLACLCCDGKLQIVEVGSDPASFFAMCNPVDPSGIVGICGRPPPSPFADSFALQQAVTSCLAVDSTGENCCSRTDFPANCGPAGTTDMPGWDTSAVTRMNGLFRDKTEFNQDISRWDTSEVTDMNAMFGRAREFNQPLVDWNTGAVTNMEFMFNDALKFNQPIAAWNTGAVTDMKSMFDRASKFNQPIADWDTSNVMDMERMFNLASDFNQPIAAWNTGAVTNMKSMFNRASKFNQPIADWDTTKVERMDSMFKNAEAFNNDITCWNTVVLTDSDRMFDGAVAWKDAYVRDPTSASDDGPPDEWGLRP
jgi:surface protein